MKYALYCMTQSLCLASVLHVCVHLLFSLFLCTECNVTYDEDSNVCAVKCEPSTDAAVVRVNNNVLGYDDRCLDQQTWNKFYCLWKENGLSVGAKIKSDSGIFKFKYDPAITSCDDKWCELDIEFGESHALLYQYCLLLVLDIIFILSSQLMAHVLVWKLVVPPVGRVSQPQCTSHHIYTVYSMCLRLCAV